MKQIARKTRKPERPSAASSHKNRPDLSRLSRTRTREAARRPSPARRPKPKRKLISRKTAKPPVQDTPAPDAQAVKEVLDHLTRAQAELTSTGIDLLNVAHAIGRNAVATFKQELVVSLVQDNLLQDLDQLQNETAASPLPADRRLLPEATLNWLCRHLELSQHLQPGQELEVPIAQLSQYDLSGPTPDPAKPLVNLQVVAPGWKYRGRTVIRPRVIVAVSVLPAAPETCSSGQLALEIDFEARIEAVLKRHTALICWNKPGMSPVADREDNGTCCFIQTEKLRCAATCAHVWDGFLKDAAEKGAGIMWLSLIANDESPALVWAYEVHKPTLISQDTSLDLATFSFEGIDALEPWRFHRLRHTAREKALEGEGVFFLGYTGDEVRKTSAEWRLGFTRFSLTVADVGHRQFLLHDSPGARHSIERSGREVQVQRIPGISGAPVFRLANLSPGPLDLALVGFASRLSSPGLTNSRSEPVGVNSDQRYEMSDGDIYVTHSRFIHPDGSIHD